MLELILVMPGKALIKLEGISYTTYK